MQDISSERRNQGPVVNSHAAPLFKQVKWSTEVMLVIFGLFKQKETSFYLEKQTTG